MRIILRPGTGRVIRLVKLHEDGLYWVNRPGVMDSQVRNGVVGFSRDIH